MLTETEMTDFAKKIFIMGMNFFVGQKLKIPIRYSDLQHDA